MFLKKLLFILFIYFPLAQAAAKPTYQNIDASKVLFGDEYSFQDKVMTQEPGRNTSYTPYKVDKAKLVALNLALELGLGSNSVQPKIDEGGRGFKEGYTIFVPGDGTWTITMEPVAIEVTAPPRTSENIKATAEKIFSAAQAAGLVPYINAAAERSGMGHKHVGGTKLGESPFFISQNLLRNMIVLFHNHPSLLYGFAEAFDVGPNSNIENEHSLHRQEVLKGVVAAFDDYFKKEPIEEGRGFQVLMLCLMLEKGGLDFFKHYRFINLEYFQGLAKGAILNFEQMRELVGKWTVEFRILRPPRSPLMAEATTELLLKLMDQMAEPGHLEPLKIFSEQEMALAHTSTVLEADWQEVKARFDIKNSALNSSQNELIKTLRLNRFQAEGLPAGAEVFISDERKDQKFRHYEVRVPATDLNESPKLSIGAQDLNFSLVKLQDKAYWVATLDAVQAKILPSRLRNVPQLGEAKKLSPVKIVKSPNGSLFVFAQPQDGTDALQSWWKNLLSSPHLVEFANAGLVKTARPTVLTKQKPLAAILTNEVSDLETGIYNPDRTDQFTRIVTSLGFQPIFIPVAATYGLSASERQAFENWLNTNVSLLIAMGGDDISPDLYGEPNAIAISPNRARDLEEISVIRSYLTNSQGRLIGICRGMQLAAVAAGLKLVDDIPERTGSKIHMASSEMMAAGDFMATHSIETKTTTHSLLRSIVGPEWQTNSYHHQSVKFMPNTRFEIAATALDGIVEALESRDGRALLVQFHPELMIDKKTRALTPESQRFWSGITRWADPQPQLEIQRTCSALFL
jgi:gamma-glutamyl-gamma-aminobutyrate hydrolase PuuD